MARSWRLPSEHHPCDPAQARSQSGKGHISFISIPPPVQQPLEPVHLASSRALLLSFSRFRLLLLLLLHHHFDSASGTASSIPLPASSSLIWHNLLLAADCSFLAFSPFVFIVLFLTENYPILLITDGLGYRPCEIGGYPHCVVFATSTNPFEAPRPSVFYSIHLEFVGRLAEACRSLSPDFPLLVW
jgi:hypothetical protein